MASIDIYFECPYVSWTALLLVLSYGGGCAARRLARDRDSLACIREFIKFAPDWKALYVALKTPQPRVYSGNTLRYVTPFPNLDTAIMEEYVRFLNLFVGAPYGYISPPPLWPVLRNGPADPAILRKIWRFHSQQASYGEDCLIFTGRKIPFYEYEDGPDRGDGPKDAGLLGYRRTFKRYTKAFGTPPSSVWPDVTALVALANKCQSHLDDESAEYDDSQVESNLEDSWSQEYTQESGNG